MTGRLVIIALLLLAVRCLTIQLYSQTDYYHGSVVNQFSIAEAYYHGYAFAQDLQLTGAVKRDAERLNRPIPVEAWKSYPRSGLYTTFPAIDLPGYGYLIAGTSKLLGTELTSRYVMMLQVAVEICSVLVLVCCTRLVAGENVAFVSGLLYVFAYPFIWPIVSLPLRDSFALGTISCYLAAFFIFCRRQPSRCHGLLVNVGAVLLIGLAALTLWVRPTGYYYFFIVSPLALWVKSRGLIDRVVVLVATILVPILIFGLPLRQFNQRYYGVEDTDLIGRGLWEGMGIVGDNPYGFVLNDNALVPWAARHGYGGSYGSPEMNRLLGAYARAVIRKDPGFYLKAVGARIVYMAQGPLAVILPSFLLPERHPGVSRLSYARQHPVTFAVVGLCRLWSLVFFYGGLAAAVAMYRQVPDRRLEILVIISPLLYTLVPQVFLHFETRYMAVAAWVLVMPLAWWIDQRLPAGWKNVMVQQPFGSKFGAPNGTRRSTVGNG